MVATSGASLLRPEAIELYRARLFPRATLVTPNMDEVAVLTGRPVQSLEDMREAGAALAARYRTAWLLKGGHLAGDEATDLLFHLDGEISEFRSDRVQGVSTHGTGCTTSAAIAAGLATGLGLDEAVAQAKRFVTAAIRYHHRWGAIHALNHGGINTRIGTADERG
jgi:hydroxymethylpyrimidine/phosphomethylpyrimidine kinase